MKIYLKFDFNTICKKVLQEKLDTKNLKHRVLSFGEVDFLEHVSKEDLADLASDFAEYGIEIIEDQKTALVQKIKDTLVNMVFSDEDIHVKSSVYLAEKLNHSYGYLSNLFSEVTYTSIENYLIMQRIERAKQLIVNNKLTLTEISYKLHYSSVAHLSTQFKNTTGITPSQFQKIISKRRDIANKS
ncbi:helix-turn-helix domain-containing protein [Frigoriflavimonas asaccharolytica]|uniref:YesN/AraC family two-component response regulator n=1 Tax=Frigoriflavimonas asaccharolytica TaxID=2735899 RepID=A0A8J8K890_9FLAO|nr:helix-turn-helix transcriptional regulator [Frigoriflavimonas asaccharolytica]NRS92356.1 YesN/AraC family two-component response regulator [Frigoriflavimonas asaccharolytica]